MNLGLALTSARNATFPLLERVFPGVKFSGPAHKREFAGVIRGETPRVAARRLLGRDYVYVNNFAKVKYVEQDGERTYEEYSLAYRPGGRFGLWQTHWRLFPHSEGTALIVHYEYNPLSRPQSHYGGENWNAQKGIEITRRELDLDTDAAWNGIGN